MPGGVACASSKTTHTAFESHVRRTEARCQPISVFPICSQTKKEISAVHIGVYIYSVVIAMLSDHVFT